MTDVFMTFLIWLWQVQISSEDSSPVIQVYPVKKLYPMQLSFFFFNSNSAVNFVIRYQFSESWSDGQKRLVRTTLQNLQAKFRNSCIRFPEIKQSDRIWTSFQNQVCGVKSGKSDISNKWSSWRRIRMLCSSRFSGQPKSTAKPRSK